MSSLYQLSTLNESFMTIDQITSSKEFDKSLFENMIEFDDKMCIAELCQTKGYYSSIMESSPYVLHEGVIESIIEFIKSVINNIIGFFKAMFSGSSSSNPKTITGKQTAAKKNQESIKVNITKIPDSYKKAGRVRVYKYPLDIPQFSSAFPEDQINAFNDICNRTISLQNGIKNLNEGGGAGYINNISKLCEDLTSKVKGNELDTFNVVDEDVPNMADYAMSVAKDFTSGKRYKLTFYNLPTNPPKEINNFIKAYEGLTNVLKELEAKAPKNVEATRNLINKEAALITFMEKWYATYTKTVFGYLQAESAYINSFFVTNLKKNKSEVQQDNEESKQVEESARIQLDILDESLTANYARYKYTMYDLIKEGMIKEALIKANPESDVIYEMQILNEGIAQKAKNAFNKAIEYIKKLFATFMEKLRANFTTTKNYLDKYKKIILGTKIPDGTYTGKDFINGMYRVIEFEIPAFDYQSIKGDLGSYFTFFNNRLINNNKTIKGNEFPINMVTDGDPNQTLTQIGEAFKTYFGCAGNDVNYSSQQVQNHIKDLYDFLYDIRKIDKSLNNSLKNLETMRANALKQTGMPQTTAADVEQAKKDGQQAQSAVNGKAQQTVNASYYFSYLDNLNSILEDFKPNDSNTATNNQQTPPQNMTGKVAGVTKTVADANKNTDGTTNYGTQGVDNSQVNKDCDVYIKVATKALQAKLTAIEFIRSETMKIFRYMVETSIEGRATSTQTAQNTTTMPRQ